MPLSTLSAELSLCPCLRRVYLLPSGGDGSKAGHQDHSRDQSLRVQTEAGEGRKGQRAWARRCSHLQLIGQVRLCSARVDLDVVGRLLQLIVPLRLGHLYLTQALCGHLLLLGLSLLLRLATKAKGLGSALCQALWPPLTQLTNHTWPNTPCAFSRWCPASPVTSPVSRHLSWPLLPRCERPSGLALCEPSPKSASSPAERAQAQGGPTRGIRKQEGPSAFAFCFVEPAATRAPALARSVPCH